jgi:hypothetical protein
VESSEVKVSVGWGKPGQIRQGDKQLDRP